MIAFGGADVLHRRFKLSDKPESLYTNLRRPSFDGTNMEVEHEECRCFEF